MRPARDGTTRLALALTAVPVVAKARSLCHAALLMLRMFESKAAADCPFMVTISLEFDHAATRPGRL